MKMRHRLPRTSYGYLPPPEATACGWRCPGDECGHTGSPAPRRWPYRCTECGVPADPILDPPWSHAAEGHELRYKLAGAGDRSQRPFDEAKLAVWLYKDALLRGNKLEAANVRGAYRRRSSAIHPIAFRFGTFLMVQTAIELDDLDAVAEEILAWYPLVETIDLENDNERRTVARQFVAACIDFLSCSKSIGHPQEQAVQELMRDVGGRAEDVLTTQHARGFKRVWDMRATRAEAIRLAEQSRSHLTTGGPGLRLPRSRQGRSVREFLSREPDSPVHQRIRNAEAAIAAAKSRGESETLIAAIRELVDVLSVPEVDHDTFLRAAVAMTDAAIVLDETHDDPGLLLDAAERLERSGRGAPPNTAVTGLARLLRARAALTGRRADSIDADQHFAQAVAELRQAAATADGQTPGMMPEIHATLARLMVDRDPDALDQAIEVCEVGRRRGLRIWRRATAADITLARLLLWRALRPETEPVLQAASVRKALRLSRRQCRPWHSGGIPARLALNEALCTRDALSGGGAARARMDGWRKAMASAAGSATTDRVRLATAWATWAVDTGDAVVAAEAYYHLISLVPLQAATRYRSAAKDKVLTAAQEHAEEAGYWLARAGRYRDAVIALEIGRAVKLSEITVRDRGGLADLLTRAGHHDLVQRLHDALKVLEEEERRPAESLGPSVAIRQAWADVRTAGRVVAATTGVDPLALDLDYDTITAVTGDGPVVYIAAAKAGGYALIVASRHDPQFVALPKFDRRSIAELLEIFLPDAENQAAAQSRLSDGLKWLWENGMRDLMLMHAHGAIVTLVPVGLLGLVPLHAAGAPGPPGDRYTEWRHASHFSAIRYAPNARTLCWGHEVVDRLADSSLALFAADVAEGHGSSAPLFYASAETDEVARLWGEPAVSLTHDCTWRDFLSTADSHPVWHLVCHGRAYPSRISESTLHFADEAITLARLRAELGRAGRRLAILSACESHLTGSTNPNEAIGLPSALLQLGFAGVIAPAWSVNDLATTFLMARYYRFWRQENRHPVIALNLAQQWLRRATSEDLAAVLPNLAPIVDLLVDERGPHPFEDPVYWAAFAYTGA